VFFHQDLGWAQVGFTDAGTDLGRTDAAEAVQARRRAARSVAGGLDAGSDGALDVVSMHQVHGPDAVLVGRGTPTPTADALVTRTPGVALVVRVADCTPVLLASEDGAVAAAVHAGREGLVRGVVPRAVERVVADGPTAPLHAWVGPRACGRCYELPADLADAVDAAVPGTRSTTSWGTPAVDVGAGVVAQLEALGVTVHDVGAGACTIEDDRFWSHRRQGERAGRMGGVVVLAAEGRP
jgi:YfiH family protein